MMTTKNCTYKTPCGWCSKWDKECDKKIDYPRGKRVEIGVYDDAIKCDHEWMQEINYMDGTRRIKCEKCGLIHWLDNFIIMR